MSSNIKSKITMMMLMRTVSDSVKQEVAKLIRDWRESNGLTQQDLANKIPCSLSMVTKWEAAKSIPGTQTIKQRLKKITGIDVDKVVNGNH